MKVDNYLYITDSYIYIKNKKKNDLIKYKLEKNIIYGGTIVNYQKFVKIYEHMLNKNNLNNGLIGETIKVLITPNYQQINIDIIKYILNNFNYRKVLVEKETKYYNLKSNNAYLNVLDNVLFLTYLDEYKKIKTITIDKNLFLEELDLLEYIKYQIKNKDLLLFGDNSFIFYILEEFEKRYNNKTYIFSKNEIYLFSLIN